MKMVLLTTFLLLWLLSMCSVISARGPYIGCYSFSTLHYVSDEIDSHRCQDFCYQRTKYTFAGLKGGRQCYCGDELASEPSVGACNSTCLDPRALDPRCGGQSHVDVFSLCPQGSYAIGCNLLCLCQNGGVCHRITEHCICFGNFYSTYCELQDVNECSTENGRCFHECHNTVGSYECRCKQGYELDQDKISCTDVDECAAENVCSYECHNTAGSYECGCGQGYQLDRDKRSCIEKDECQTNTSGCSYKCEKTAGSYRCLCAQGYELGTDQRTCQDKNECETKESGCSQNCTNTDGSYKCHCNGESALSPDKHTCNNTGSHVGAQGDNTFSDVPVAAGAAAGLAVIIIIVLLVVLLLRRRKRTRHDTISHDDGQEGPAGVVVGDGPGESDTVGQNREKREDRDENGNDLSVAERELNDIPDVITDDLIALRLPQTDREEGNLHDVSAIIQPPQPKDKLAEHRYENSEDDDRYGSQELLKPSKCRKKAAPAGIDDEMTSRVVTLTVLQEYITRGKADDNADFEEEFLGIPTKSGTFKVAQSVPKEKNKFKNILPYDENRVVLDDNGDKFSDYINASYITIPGGNKKYIACQGPQEKTVGDFWRMVWETDTNIIIMLTNPVEGGKRKCEKYWDHTGGGILEISVIKVENYGEFMRRILTITKSGKERQVSQYHFHSWPDHGVPDNATGLLQMRMKIENGIKEDKFIVIHCSAGVGRTGTYLSIDHLLEQADIRGYVDVPEFVAALRERRTNMVQTLTQYVFIYDALLEGVSVGNTAIPSDRFIETDTDDNKAEWVKQYQFLESTTRSLTEDDTHAAHRSNNKEKNRRNTFLPADDWRVRLTSPLIGRDDYIMAVFADAYEGERSSIATQVPLADTVKDFWAMVHGYKCSTVVILEDRAQLGEMCPSLLPEEENSPASYGQYQVTITGSEPLDCPEILKVTVKEDEGDQVKVDVIILKGDFDSDFIFQTFDRVKARRERIHTPFVVMCRDGVSRCGVYLAATNMFSKINLEHDVDVFYSVRRLRNSSPYFITSQEQYMLLYKIAGDYIRAFDMYSNFK